jgi:hypothetical protein
MDLKTRILQGTTALLGAAVLMNLACGLPGAHAAEPSEGLPGDWLSQYSGARAIGFGGAFVAIADEPSGILWNPAGLTQLMQHEVNAGTVRLFEETSVNHLSFGMPESRLPSFGLTILSMGSGGFQRTNDLNEVLGDFEAGNTAFLFSLAKRLNTRFAIGANLKVVRQSIEDFSGSGTGFDLGGLYWISPAFRVGVSLLNLGGPTITLREEDEKYPTELRSGAALTVLDGKGTLSGEIAHRSGPGTKTRGGAEYWLVPSMALRLGYDDQNVAGGFSYRFASGLQIDYGLSDHVLGVTHRFAISYRFGGFFASSQATPEVFSPSGQHSVTKFLLTARTRAEAQDWRLRVFNKSDELVRQFGGQGVPPAHVLWDGKDETGLPLPDGLYRYLLEVTDGEGNVFTSRELTVEITTSGPQGTVPVIVD